MWTVKTLPEIIAHRGATYLAPENTLTAFQNAIVLGADGVEMDVQQTKDQGLIIHHDYLIDLGTEISAKIYDLTLGELEDIDLTKSCPRWPKRWLFAAGWRAAPSSLN